MKLFAVSLPSPTTAAHVIPRILALALTLCFAPSASLADPIPEPVQSSPIEDDRSHLVLVPCTRDLVARARAGDVPARLEIDRRTERELLARSRASDDSRLDYIVVCTDQNGAPIEPDRESVAVAAPLTALTDLSFTYNSPSYPWSPTELATLQTFVNDFYPQIKALYGDPAFSITVNIRKDPTISVEGQYNTSTNEIALRGLIADVVCHEMVHAFRDDHVTYVATFEEGMARATEVEVFNQLPGYTHWDENHSYVYDVFYEAHNREGVASYLGLFGASSANTLMKYQLSGYAWWKVYREDPLFFRKFNQTYYALANAFPSIDNVASQLRDIATPLRTSVEGHSFPYWYSLQQVLNANPPGWNFGAHIYQRIGQLRGQSYTISFFLRNGAGEIPYQGYPVDWQLSDYSGTTVASGSATTNQAGVISVSPTLPPGYIGRLRSIATGTAAQTATDTAYTCVVADDSGFFGIVHDPAITSITLTPIAPPGSPVTAPVNQGAFYALSFSALSGYFQVRANYSDGRRSYRWATKDKGSYYLDVSQWEIVSGVEADSRTISEPSKIRVAPNPSNGATWIQYGLDHPGLVTVRIFTAEGKFVRTVVEEIQQAGKHHAFWNGRTWRGEVASAGVYFASVSRVAGTSSTTKILLIR